jgi:hypothetical protein
MNMYTHLLSSVFDEWVDALTGEALIDYALICRAETLGQLSQDARGRTSAYIALGAEVAYDRALIKLCVASGIEVSAEGFSHPAAERNRLERKLASCGINLAHLARQQES